MNATCIHDLSELLGDDAMYPACQGYKRPDSPSFIFRDEKGQEDSDVLYARDLALDFEEWVERQNQRESYLKGDLIPAFVPCDKSDLEFILATMDEVEAWMEHPTKNKRPVMVSRDKDGALHEWAPQTPAEAEAYFARQENRELCNWLVGWHKRRPANNDHWRRFVAPLADALDDKVMGITAKTILVTMRDTLPFAPGPVKETVFVNPDKTRVVTRLAPGTAKAGYQLRHKIPGELVTMDRVQYEGEKTSRFVIGTRKDSSKTASSYYDPEPIKGDKGYVPRACTLIKLPASKVMPDESCYVLTIRELERAIIAGADLCENDIEALAASFEDQDSQFDTRESGLSFDDSCDFRTMLDLDEQEQWLYWKMWEAGLENACQSMLVRDASDISRYLPGMDGACTKMGNPSRITGYALMPNPKYKNWEQMAENKELPEDFYINEAIVEECEPLTEDEEIATELLNAARDEDLRELEKTGRVEWSRYDLLRALD